MPRKYDAIFFDFDGVLVDSEPVHYQCWKEILSGHGLALSWTDYETNCIGVSDKAMIQALCGIASRPDLFDGIWAGYPRKRALFRERMMSGVPMPEATRELLHGLGGYYSMAVVSSSGRLEVEPALEAAGVRGLFQTLVTGEDVRSLKPSPEPYLCAAQRLGVHRALVVEDSQAGIASGRAAGFDVLAVPGASSMPQLLRERLGSPE